MWASNGEGKPWNWCTSAACNGCNLLDVGVVGAVQACTRELRCLERWGLSLLPLRQMQPLSQFPPLSWKQWCHAWNLSYLQDMHLAKVILHGPDTKLVHLPIWHGHTLETSITVARTTVVMNMAPPVSVLHVWGKKQHACRMWDQNARSQKTCMC